MWRIARKKEDDLNGYSEGEEASPEGIKVSTNFVCLVLCRMKVSEVRMPRTKCSKLLIG